MTRSRKPERRELWTNTHSHRFRRPQNRKEWAMRKSACEWFWIFCQNFSEACTLMNTQRPKKWNRNLNVLSSIKERQLLHWVKIAIADQINALGGENKTRTNGGQTLISSFLLVKLSNSHKWGGHIARKVRKKQKPSKAAKRTYTKWGRVGRADLSNNSRRAENQWWIMWRADMVYASRAVCAK